jgi:putative peptidoglycan lipid II flippase
VSVFRSGFIVAFFTLLSRIFGLFRELFLAYVFGSSKEADCLNVALKLPNLFRRIFGEGALSSIFIPMYNQKMVANHSDADIFAGQICTLLFCVLTIITILMQIFMPQIMIFLAPGFYQSSDKFELSVLLCRITMPYLIFISVSALLGGMLNSINQFKSFAAAPIILNIVIILACIVESEFHLKPYIISFAILLSGILQLAFMYYNIRRNNLQASFTKQMISQDSKYLLNQMLPAILSAGIVQISLFISQSLASFIDGAISILGYAERVYQLPLSLIGTAFGTVLLPELSRLYNNKDLTKALQTQENAIKFGLYISIPCSVGIFILSDLIIHIIYQRGAFTSLDTIITSECLAAFSVGLPAFILNKIFTPIFYANNDPKTPLKITFYSLTINIILNLIFMKLYGAVGIAIGSSIAAWINVYLLFSAAKKNSWLTLHNSISIFMAKVLTCNLFMAVIVIAMKHIIWNNQATGLLKFISLAGIISSGALSYCISSLLTGIISKKNIFNFGDK